MDTLTFRNCLSFCNNLETLEILFRHTRKYYKGLSVSARIGLGAESFYGCTAATYMAKVGLSVSQLAVVRFPEPDNGSALHHVAEALAKFPSDLEGWTQLGVDIIQNGADLFSVKMSRRTSSTPLMVILSVSGSNMGASPFSAIRQPLQRWNDVLRRANVDLECYCARESEIWKTLGTEYRFWTHRSTTCPTWLSKLKFCRETQSCIPVFRDDAFIPIMRLRLIPGSFIGSQYPIETICWSSLSREEEEEGHWRRVRRVVIRSSLTYDYDPKQESRCWYSKLIDCTQDDNGTLLRMTRPSRNGNGSNKRASSQPPSQRRTRDDGQNLFSSRLHAWLPPYHYCHVRSTWTVSCHHGHLRNWQDPSVSNEARLCVYQKDNEDIDIGEHEWLEGANFLVEIRDCKSFRRRKTFLGQLDRPLHPLHSYRTGCSQGCDQIDLEKLAKLAKPHYLPRWHPCRDEL
jgi:hypothetical protein